MAMRRLRARHGGESNWQIQLDACRQVVLSEEIGPVAKVRVNMTYAGGEVMFNSDLIFLSRDSNSRVGVVQQIDWPDADYLYKLSVEDPRVVVSKSEIAAKGTQLLEQSSPPMPEDVREAFRDAVHLYVDCKLGSPERSISFRRLQRISLSGVCDLVLGYRNEPLPLDIHCGAAKSG